MDIRKLLHVCKQILSGNHMPSTLLPVVDEQVNEKHRFPWAFNIDGVGIQIISRQLSCE